jgi:hypothetical protein
MTIKSLGALYQSKLIVKKDCWKDRNEQEKIGRIIGRFKSAHLNKKMGCAWERLFYEGVMFALAFANEQQIDIEEKLIKQCEKS